MKKIILLVSAFFIFNLFLPIMQSKVFAADYDVTHFTLSQETSSGTSYGDCFEKSKPISLNARILKNNNPMNERISIIRCNQGLSFSRTVDNGNISTNFTIDRPRSSCQVHFGDPGFLSMTVNYFYVSNSFEIKDECSAEDIEVVEPTPAPIPKDDIVVAETWKLCNQLKAGDPRDRCNDCWATSGVWTAVGCIPTDPTNMIQVLIRIGLMIGGGVALLIILAGSFVLSTSQGDPKKTSEAKEMITSALIGLVFIIFSVSILQLIGVQILQIPGFGN